jgi:hypothetical protein
MAMNPDKSGNLSVTGRLRVSSTGFSGRPHGDDARRLMYFGSFNNPEPLRSSLTAPLP